MIIIEWSIRILMIPLVIRRLGSRPQAATAWLAVIFLIPWVGLFLYVFFGYNRLPERRARRHERVQRVIQTVYRLGKQNPHIVQPAIDPDMQELANLTERMGEMRILGGNEVQILSETERTIDLLIADIDVARHHVHLLFYIYENDETGRRVTEALIRAVKRGVKCRVLVDAVGSVWAVRKLLPWMRSEGIEVEVALPVRWFRKRLARIDLRNHRKLAVIDGTTAYTGSQNIVNPTYGQRHVGEWHDLMVRIVGPTVMQLQLVFLQDWLFETEQMLDSEDIFPQPPTSGQVPMQTIPSGPGQPTDVFRDLFVAAIHQAKRHIVITNPYVIPDEPVMCAMRLAVLRGVKIELVVPKRTDHPLVTAAGRAWYDDLLAAGVDIYLHTRGVLHSKTLTVDDSFAMIGSGNMDIRSFALNFELNVLLYGPEVTTQLRYAQRAYIAESQRLDPAVWAQRPWTQWFWQDVARLFSPVL